MRKEKQNDTEMWNMKLPPPVSFQTKQRLLNCKFVFRGILITGAAQHTYSHSAYVLPDFFIMPKYDKREKIPDIPFY